MPANDHRRYPVIANQEELKIPWEIFATVLQGHSVIDSTEFVMTNPSTAERFLAAYGLDPSDHNDLQEIQTVLSLARSYLQNHLLPYQEFAKIPTPFVKMPLPEIMQIAAGKQPATPSSQQTLDPRDQRLWACVILKICHAVAHALWTHDAEAHAAATKALKKRYSQCFREDDSGLWIGDDQCQIPLIRYAIKDTKALHRVVTKLLHKKGNLSQNVYDRLGVRFVVEDAFSAILLLRFLRTRAMFMYVNALPGEAKNTLVDFETIRRMFSGHLAQPETQPQEPPAALPSLVDAVNQEINRFSSRSFHMIKVVERLMVKTPSGRRVFYPYEIQILTADTDTASQAGDADHKAYEQRQLQAVGGRLFRC